MFCNPKVENDIEVEPFCLIWYNRGRVMKQVGTPFVEDFFDSFGILYSSFLVVSCQL